MLDNDLRHAETVEGKAQAMTAAKDPRLCLVVAMLHALAPFDSKELRVESLAEGEHVITLEARILRGGASGNAQRRA